jgi:membrane-anchored protein YejM (alkaline phosphatase superfamily)
MPRSVLLITVDSLRPDAITDAERTPAFARLAAEGTSFEAESSPSGRSPRSPRSSPASIRSACT